MVLGGFVGSVLTGVRERVATVARRCAVPVRPMKGRLVRVWLVPRGRNARGHAGGRGRRAGRLPTRSRMGWRNGASGLCGDDFQASCTHPTLIPFRATNVVVARGLSRLDELNILDRKSTRLNSSHRTNSYAVFCFKKNTTAAALLARAGWRVALLDKVRFPQRKVCG